MYATPVGPIFDRVKASCGSFSLTKMAPLPWTLAFHLLIVQTLLWAAVECIGPENSAASSLPAAAAGGSQNLWRPGNLFQSVALEMILFPTELDTNCQKLCNKWFSTFDDFIRKPKRGVSMLRYPMTLSRMGTKIRPIRKDKEAEQAFIADPCLYHDRYCIANADIWLAPFTPDELSSIDLDRREALNAVKSLARDTMHYSRPKTLQSMSYYFFGQCCMCRKFAIFSAVRVRRPDGADEDKSSQRRNLREFPDVECQPNDICHRLNEQLFGLNQRSNQWFCNSAFVVKGIPGQGLKATREYPKHCPCELDYANPLTHREFKTVCYTPESILDGIVDAGIRTLEQGQRELQITSLRTLINDESSRQTRTKPNLSTVQVVQNKVSSLDDCVIQNSQLPNFESSAAAEHDSCLPGQEPRTNFLASSLSPQAQTDALGELGQAASAATHRAIGELDFLASRIARQSHRQLQPHQQMVMSRQQAHVNPVLESNVAQAASLAYDMNLDSFVFGSSQSERFFQDMSSSCADDAAPGSSSQRQIDKGKRKASEVELSDRLRASRASIQQQAYSELGAAVEAFLQSDDDSKSLDFVLQQNQGTTFQAPEPRPLQELLSQLQPEVNEAAVDLDSPAAEEEEMDISELFFP